MHDTPRDLAERVTEAIAGAVRGAVDRHGRCSLLLSGGSTPRASYEELASRHRGDLPWPQVHLFWGDERFVAASDPRSNARMAREALIDHVAVAPANVHPIPTDVPSADAAASHYEATLRAYFGERPPVFDLVLLGLGEDAHTASIFPGSPALAEPVRWVMAAAAPVDPPQRITLTMPVLTSASRLYVLVSGSGKAAALRRALDPASDPALYPAAALQSAGDRVIWWTDRAARAV